MYQKQKNTHGYGQRRSKQVLHSHTVAKITVAGSEPTIIDLGRVKQSPESIVKALERKAKNELTLEQTAKIELQVPRRKKKTFTVTGVQPLRKRIINYPGSWAPPEQVAEDIRKELQNPKRKTASDAEVVAYLSSASACFPFDEQWVRIYMYVTRNYLESKGWKNFKGSMKFLDAYKTLREDDKRELDHLRSWIYETQNKDLAERQKKLAREAKVQVQVSANKKH